MVEQFKDLNRAPKRIPHKLSSREEQNIVVLRNLTSFGARRLKYECSLRYSAGTIYKVIKQNGLI